MKLNVPYKKQWGVGANESRNDCGPTCLAMILAAYGIHKTVDEVFRATGAAPDALINFDQLIRAGATFNLKLSHHSDSLAALKQKVEQGRPAIALINYRYFPNKQDSYNGGHFVTVIGKTPSKVIVHDPNRLRGDAYGDSVELTNEEFINVWERHNEEHSNKNSQILVPDQPIPNTGGLTRRQAIVAAYKGVYNRAPSKSELDRWDMSQKGIDICIKELIASLEYEKKIGKLEEKIERLEEINSSSDAIIDKHLSKIRDLDAKNKALVKDKKELKANYKEVSEQLKTLEANDKGLEAKLKSTEALNEKVIKQLADKDDEIEEIVEQLNEKMIKLAGYKKKWNSASGVSLIIEGLNRIFRGGEQSE